MFLAWKEIKHSKFRYALIVGVLFLIAYLVFFLVGLANGLSQQNKTAITAWEADGIVLTKESNENLSASLFTADLADTVDGGVSANLLQVAASVEDEADPDGKQTSIRIFGIEEGAFIEPEILTGKAATADNEVVIDKYLQKKLDLALGDNILLVNVATPLTIVGTTKAQSISIAPVLFTSMDTALEISKEKNTMNEAMAAAMPDILSAVIVKTEDGTLDEVTISDDSLKIMPIADFISVLPGYSAQNLTFLLMIFFLILIGAIVAGIFIYVLTMQKQQIFGVMKAQGISNMFIIKSVVIQTALLSFIGVLLGLVITLLTALALPITVPFTLEIAPLLMIAFLMIFFATIGGLFSAGSIIKVDPLKSIA